jgi:RHS repeat-associated protein
MLIVGRWAARGPPAQNKSGTYTEVVYAPAGNKLAFMSVQTLSKAYIPLPAGAVAAYNSSGLNNYHHVDWLGSFRLASTPSRTVPFDTAYAPFGESYVQSGSYIAAFTGQTQDTHSNVYDFPAREYGIQGRWPSPDPAGLASVDPADPQTWNRYAYVRNSPLGNVDPNGMEMKDSMNADAGGGMLGVYVGGAVGGGIDWFPVPGVWVGNHEAEEYLGNGGFEVSGGSSYGGGGSFWGGLVGSLFKINIPGLFGISMPSPIQNWHYDSSGLAVPDRPYDSLQDCSPDGSCQTLLWYQGKWQSQCAIDPDWCNAADVLGRSATLASPKNIFTIYAASVVAGAAAPFAEPAYLWLRTHPLEVVLGVQCAAGAFSATSLGGSLPPGTTGPAGNVCKAAAKGMIWTYDHAQ